MGEEEWGVLAPFDQNQNFPGANSDYESFQSTNLSKDLRENAAESSCKKKKKLMLIQHHRIAQGIVSAEKASGSPGWLFVN